VQNNLSTLLPEAALQEVHGLVNFKLSLNSGLTHLEATVIEALPKLTRLDLSCNSLRRIPPTITGLSSLEVLNLSRNASLKVSKGCTRVLDSMPALRKVYRPRKDHGKV
jgi:Leucine-rich repeat (LRR) protein